MFSICYFLNNKSSVELEEESELTLAAISPVRVTPRPGGPGPYRLATICLATLCAVLLISIIAVTAHYKNKPPSAGGATSAMQKQDAAAVSDLTAAVSKLQEEKKRLQEEKKRLQEEKDELLAKLEPAIATKAPEGIKPTTAAPIVCPADWLLFNGSCYFISRTTRDWPESQSYCQSKGGHLAIIHTPEEQTFLWDHLPRGHWRAFWFGLSDEHTEVIGNGFWEVGEPNNHIDEDCGYIVKTQVLERVAIRSWYDAPCSMYWPFICEKEMVAGGSTAVPH
uniref:C-type lectin domain-containing protein n=1 Tax=Cyclopterus lumpus TaxID=8103 RepID=A0A8C2WM68_CYCLU